MVVFVAFFHTVLGDFVDYSVSSILYNMFLAVVKNDLFDLFVVCKLLYPTQWIFCC